ncbi:MAG: hypothetical protein ISS48_03425 [Candidatus Aenigmarchaeota archaeon]|nr:hypothetical protein [Candidatus Aenigmarchaeota archaeon]
MSRKGISFSIIPIIALLGVLGLSIWAGYQLSVGSEYVGGYGDIGDPEVFKMETVKKILEDGLKFSAQDASLEIAANGGTDSTTFWYCGGEGTVPTPEEVKYYFSETIRSGLNAYVDNSKSGGELFEIDVDIPKYTCVGVYDNGISECSSLDSSGCEDFWVTGTGYFQIILNEDPTITEEDSISALILQNRFFWIYYSLYQEYLSGNSLDSLIQDAVCDPNGDGVIDEEEKKRMKDGIEDRIKTALKNICEHYENELFTDGYVDCSYEIDCFFEREGEDSPCYKLNSQCVRDEFTQGLCGAPEVRVSGKVEGGEGKKIFFNGPCVPEYKTRFYDETDYLRFRIVLEDRKYKIPSMTRTLRNLVWKVHGVVPIDYSDCPIEWTVDVNPTAGPEPGPPGPAPQPPPPPP